MAPLSSQQRVLTSSPPRCSRSSLNMSPTSDSTDLTTSKVLSGACGVAAVGCTGLSGSWHVAEGQISG